MNQESRKKGKGGTRCPQRVIAGPRHRLAADEPIHLSDFP